MLRRGDEARAKRPSDFRIVAALPPLYKLAPPGRRL